MSAAPIKCDYCQGNRAMMLWQGECAACIKAERDTLRQRVQAVIDWLDECRSARDLTTFSHVQQKLREVLQ